MRWYKNSFVNRLIGGSIKLVSFTIPEIIKKRIVKKWRVAGVRHIKLNEEIQFKFYSNWDDHIADQLNFNPNSYSEINELKLFIELAGKADLIFDIGANTGLYSICSSKKNTKAKIFSFEPYPINAARLNKNITLNKLDNITIINKALGNENKEVDFVVPVNDQICDSLSIDQEFARSFYKGQIEFTNKVVQQIKLDDFIKSNGITKIDLIKIDVENYEIHVFSGALKMLEEFSPIILVEIFVNNEKVEFFEKFLKPLGYSCYIVLSEGLVKTDSLISNVDCRNYLFSKKNNESKYFSFKDMDFLVSQIMGK